MVLRRHRPLIRKQAKRKWRPLRRPKKEMLFPNVLSRLVELKEPWTEKYKRLQIECDEYVRDNH